MQINSAVNSGYLGIQRANQQVDSSSAQIASLATKPEGVDLNKELVSLKQAEIGGAASAKVVKTADEMMGTLIDIHV
ncbi:MAG: flagellar biosynthesis protein FlgE [Aeromonadaceae bacterium]|nr:flagellar biosynthesis protein FlgE [Aeromonadaceae bacterium]